jgi:hypothetical protein
VVRCLTQSRLARHRGDPRGICRGCERGSLVFSL